jgi:hypothetical protein
MQSEGVGRCLNIITTLLLVAGIPVISSHL